MHFSNLNSILFIQSQSLAWRVTYVCIATFIINLPFGCLRGRFRKLSFWWFFFIHLPVPLIILTRKFYGLHLTWKLAPFLVGSFFLGQFVGRKIYNRIPWRKQESQEQLNKIS